MTLAGRSAQPAQTVILSAQHTWQQVKGCGQQVLPPKGGVAVRQPATAESYSFSDFSSTCQHLVDGGLQILVHLPFFCSQSVSALCLSCVECIVAAVACFIVSAVAHSFGYTSLSGDNRLPVQNGYQWFLHSTGSRPGGAKAYVW